MVNITRRRVSLTLASDCVLGDGSATPELGKLCAEFSGATQSTRGINVNSLIRAPSRSSVIVYAS